jgi:hypothetical protein
LECGLARCTTTYVKMPLFSSQLHMAVTEALARSSRHGAAVGDAYTRTRLRSSLASNEAATGFLPIN